MYCKVSTLYKQNELECLFYISNEVPFKNTYNIKSLKGEHNLEQNNI